MRPPHLADVQRVRVSGHGAGDGEEGGAEGSGGGVAADAAGVHAEQLRGAARRLDAAEARERGALPVGPRVRPGYGAERVAHRPRAPAALQALRCGGVVCVQGVQHAVDDRARALRRGRGVGAATRG